MKKPILSIMAFVLLNLSCASHNAGCTMHEIVADTGKYNIIKSGQYQVFWNFPQKMVHANSDFVMYLYVNDTLGAAVANNGAGKCYARQTIFSNGEEIPQGPLWMSTWNQAAHRYEITGVFPKPGNWRLNCEFVDSDSIDIKFHLPLVVMAEMKGMETDHGSGAMQGHSGGCH
jgi:hypothetical protein